MNSCEASLPIHQSGPLKGLADWSQVEVPEAETEEQQEEEFQELQALYRELKQVWGAAWEKARKQKARGGERT